MLVYVASWPRGYKAFFVLNSDEHETIVGIFILISRVIFMFSYFGNKEFAIVSNLRFISRSNFMLS